MNTVRVENGVISQNAMAVLKQYDEPERTSGRYPRWIYTVKHEGSGRLYVGSSRQLSSRMVRHFSLLRRQLHPINDMQRDYNTCGRSYCITIIGRISTIQEKDKEYEVMKALSSNIRGHGYNYMDKHFQKGGSHGENARSER